jgi:hypothetical protein
VELLGSQPDRMNLEFSGKTWKTSLFPKDGRYIVPVKA